MSRTTPNRGPLSRLVAGPPGRQALVAIGLCAVFFAVAWFVDSTFVRPPILTPFGDVPPLTPLYAFPIPKLAWTACLFPLLAGLLVVLARRLAAPDRVCARWFSVILFCCGLVLPLSLFLIREPASSLGVMAYPAEEIYEDAMRINDLGAFYHEYVRLMPRLSLHGQHFPPGHATFLYGVQRLFGADLVSMGIVVLVVFAVGMICVYRAIQTVAGDAAARTATLVLLACPSVLDFACTSTDAVFFTVAALTLWIAVHAFRPGGHVLVALPAGVMVFVATMFSFSAVPLALAVVLHGLLTLRRDRGRGLARLALLGLGFLLAAGATRVGTGFDLWRCFNTARWLNEALMTRVIGAPPGDHYVRIAAGNGLAFLIGAGLALVPAVLLRFFGTPRALNPFTVPALVTLGAMTFAGIYVMETERIWIFAMPWLAMIAAGRDDPSPPALRVLLVAGLTQAALMEALLFTLW